MRQLKVGPRVEKDPQNEVALVILLHKSADNSCRISEKDND
jgi:hypothetical protein